MSLRAHLASGHTTIARAWALTRRDGESFGFTDHDRDLHFNGVTFRADAGLTARALEQVTGLAVDNSEAVGALIDAGLREADIMAGRYDGAELRIWQVNWAAPEQREMLFRGTLGEITREGGAFRAELRGLSEPLGQQGGRIYHASCAAVLGDAACKVDLAMPGFHSEAPLEASDDGQTLRFAPIPTFVHGFLTHGRLRVLSGPAAGLEGQIRDDRSNATGRVITLWQSLRAMPLTGDLIRLEAGCDKQAKTCRLKFNNFNNFRGFPHIPGEDWLTLYPKASGANTGGRRGK